MLSTSPSVAEILVDLGHELFHVLAAMIPRHVVVEVLPDPLDPVVVRAIRRQEVERTLPPQAARASCTWRLSWIL